jgi:hypothetical protein
METAFNQLSINGMRFQTISIGVRRAKIADSMFPALAGSENVIFATF